MERCILCQDDSPALVAASNDSGVTNHVFCRHPPGWISRERIFISLTRSGANKTVWFVGYQDVIAFGHLFLSWENIILSVWLLHCRTRRGKAAVGQDNNAGASLDELTAGEVVDGEQRSHIRISASRAAQAKGLVSFPGPVPQSEYRYCPKTENAD